MLKKFFLNMLSSFMGAWIALVLFGIVAVLVCIGIVAKIGIGSSSTPSVSKGSVMTIDLSGTLIENDIPAELDIYGLMQGNIEKTQTLSSLRAAIRAAAKNKSVDAIYLKCNGVSASPATLNALRAELQLFKESGKKIIAYGNILDMGDYYISTVADSLYLNPGGEVILQGLGGVSLYYKGLLDKLGIEMQVVKVGTYKSAVEPFILPEMSHPARAQLDTLYGNMWRVICQDISKERKGLDPEKIDSLVNKFIFIRGAEMSLKNHLVDRLVYERSMDSIIAVTLGKKKDKLNFVSPSVLVSQEDFEMGYTSSKQIAILYASGEIIDGGGATVIDYERIVPLITELADNDKVKGMVLRVNSPGGAVFGSEQIGEALDYFQSKGKPLAVSMGDYAASGGYWISCCANRIFANPLTITGSIGIFGLIPNAEGLMKKIGLSPQLVATNPDAKFPTLMTPLNPSQLDAMQEMVERGYSNFVARVAKGRHLTEERVRQIGEGRVWDAQKALEIGLVDELGGLQDAIEWTAKEANVTDYGVAYFPKAQNTVWNYFTELQNIEYSKYLSQLAGEDLSDILLNSLTRILNRKPIQARMPEMKVEFCQNSLSH